MLYTLRVPYGSSIFLAPLLAFGATALLYWAALRLFPRWGLLDFPERYGLSRSRLPYPTGSIGVGVFLLFLPFLAPFNTAAAALMIAIAVLAVICFLDDRRRLSPWTRMGTQVLVALLLFAMGARIYSLTNPLEGFVGGAVIPLDIFAVIFPILGPLSFVGALFTVLWLGLTINALNWFDGIPGQVSTITLIGFLTIGFLSLSSVVQDPALAQMAFVLAAIAAAGLLFDFPPARVVMGDTGTMFFGLMLGVLTINAGKGKVATAFLVLGVPLVDSIIVVIRRIIDKRSPLKGTATGDHLHHRLLAKGWSPRQVILFTASIGALFGITALFLNTFEKFVAAIVLGALMVGLHWYTEITDHRLQTTDKWTE